MNAPLSRRAARIASICLGGALVLALLLVIAVYLAMRMSLPVLSGEAKLASLTKPVTVTRDALGTAVISAPDFLDAMRALGYVHAQERFFEMDLTRRSAAGELSELLGRATLKADQAKRTHRFRARMAAELALAPEEDRKLLAAYADGVNAGLAALSAKPWQYMVLQATPQPWHDVDSMLVIAEMYSMLQLTNLERAFQNAALRERVGDALFAWLRPSGGQWDAALDGSEVAAAPLPTAAMLDTRAVAAASATGAEMPRVASGTAGGEAPDDSELAAMIGSNNWAVGGALTGHGGGILADDMHLGLGVPNIWFRAELHLKTPVAERRIAGITLPGFPGMVAGSNGDVAWGFTNTEGHWFDWVPVPADEPVAELRDVIAVKGEAPVPITIKETRWGPILHVWRSQSYALQWTAYHHGAINAELGNIIHAGSVEAAIPIAQRSGLPHQNILLVDKRGNTAWTIAGRMPEREAEPVGWSNFASPQLQTYRWLPVAAYPLVKNPPDGRLWTANNRQLGVAKAGGTDGVIGEGGYDLGARAGQIRDRLREKKLFDEPSLYAIQRDDEAKFMRHWAVLLKKVAGQSGSVDSKEITRLLEMWNGRADADQVGYRLARAFRSRVFDELWKAWIKAAAPDLGMAISWEGRTEYPAWQAITSRAPNLLPTPYTSWDAFLAAQAESVANELKQQYGSLDRATWGALNEARIGHPFSRAMPWLGYLLDMPHTPLSGDSNMPMVLSSGFGASERLVVAPGHEESGILTMPGGQSGHPLSPFYGAGHQDWLDGKPTPLLAGEAKYALQLVP